MPESVLQSAPKAAPARTAEVYRAAAELMVEKGYGGTSIGDIAQAVGMTKAGLYHHISGKQDLLYQILNHAIDLVQQVLPTERSVSCWVFDSRRRGSSLSHPICGRPTQSDVSRASCVPIGKARW